MIDVQANRKGKSPSIMEYNGNMGNIVLPPISYSFIS